MISRTEIIQVQPVPAAVIPITCRREDMPKVFGPAVTDLFRVLGEQGVETTGAVFAHHLRMPPGMFDFELGVEVPGAVRLPGACNRETFRVDAWRMPPIPVLMRACPTPGASSMTG